MAASDDIAAEKETAETTIAEALGTFTTNTGVKVASVDVDPSTDPPTVKIVPTLEEPTEDAPADAAAPTTIDEHFGV